MLESQDEPGGAVRTVGATLPGFRHDLYATNLTAFAGSAFLREFDADLKRHGLELLRATNAFCSVFPDGDCVGVATELEDTLAYLRRLLPRDAQAWRTMTERFARESVYMLPMLQSPMPSWRTARQLLRGSRALGPLWPLQIVHLLRQSTGAFAAQHFEHPKVRALYAAWGMHLDFAPEIPGGALYAYLQCMNAQSAGLHIARGGARAMIDALVGLFREKGGELRCSTRVQEVIVENGTATGVVAGGERICARRAIVANLTPTVLFGDLVRGGIPARLRRKARRYRYGPGTMMIHLALCALPEWRDSRARGFVYVHLAPSLETMSRTYRDAVRGVLPDEPTLVVAQPTVVDASRAPPGQHVLSIQVRVVPSAVDWDALKDAYADRVLGLMERYAPGLGSATLARCVLSPADLERANPNLVGGDNVSGSHHLGQQFIFRPFLGWSRYRTPVQRLFLCGAATWPGAGVGAGSGWLLGQMLAIG
jgi:phytoene dehydrogenase-like protein